MRPDREHSPLRWNPTTLAALATLAACATCIADDDELVQLAEFRSAEFSASFQDGVAPTAAYAGTRDTMLEQHAAKTAHGGDTALSVSGDTPGGSGKDDAAVIQWDLAATVPTDAIIHSASITLTVSDKAAQSYSLYELLRPWDEAQATWNQAASGSNWASAGAQAASDRAPAPLASITAAATGTYTIDLNAAGLAAVQRWAHDPASNHGIIVASTSNDNRLEFRASEYSGKSSRPKLTVSWDLPGPDDSGDPVDPVDDFNLVPTPGTYRGTCDGSGALALGPTHFLDLNDEDQTLRIYTQGASASPVQSLAIDAALGLAPGDEADLEDAARIGDRIYGITSHARNKDGKLVPSRYRFFALDLVGAVPNLQLQPAGKTSNLLADMLVASNWQTPNNAVLSLLTASSQLAKTTVASLAPKDQGTNIEGLAALGDTGTLLIGLRNPRSSGKALVVTLLNPAAAITGATARFGAAILLDLGGQAIRGMAWSTSHQAVLLLSGPSDEAQGPFALWQWSGAAANPPQKLTSITAPAGAGPEAVVPYPGTHDVQIIFDMGAAPINGSACKDAAPASQRFTDQILHVP